VGDARADLSAGPSIRRSCSAKGNRGIIAPVREGRGRASAALDPTPGMKVQNISAAILAPKDVIDMAISAEKWLARLIPRGAVEGDPSHDQNFCVFG
jgi:hypothetical protein